MKIRILLSILLLVSFCAIYAQGVVVPPMAPEFAEAKRIAMAANPDKDGDYIFLRPVVERGRKVGYFVYYGKQNNLNEDKVVIGGEIIGDKVLAVTYGESDGIYTFETGNVTTGEVHFTKVITEEQAASAMSNILKIIVNSGTAS